MRTEARSIRVGAVRVVKGKHAGKVGYYDDEADRAVVYFGEPIHSRYAVIKRDHLANVTSLQPERWTRAHARVPGSRGQRGGLTEYVVTRTVPRAESCTHRRQGLRPALPDLRSYGDHREREGCAVRARDLLTPSVPRHRRRGGARVRRRGRRRRRCNRGASRSMARIAATRLTADASRAALRSLAG